MHKLGRFLTLSSLVLSLVACGARAGRDLDRAVLLDGRRSLSSAVPAEPLAWLDLRSPQFAGRDSLVLIPNGACFLGDKLLVSDGGTERIDWFDPEGRHLRSLGRDGEGPGEFRRLEMVRCRDDGSGFMAVDSEEWRIQFFDADGTYRDVVAAPPIPQGIPYVGEFALARDGRFVDSWFSASLGPYLKDSDAWEGVALVRIWDPQGQQLGSLGEPTPYEDVVLRRVFNHVNADFVADTLWVLTEADATIRGYDHTGAEIGDPIPLPVYHRGVDPVVMVGRPVMDGFRLNRAAYQPNVTGLAALSGGRFAVLRFRDWREVQRGAGDAGFKDFWPRSFVDVVDRHGRVEASYELPGRAAALASDKGGRVAVITEDLGTAVRTVLVASLPGVAPRAADRPVVLAEAPGQERPAAQSAAATFVSAGGGGALQQ
ncbi:MAG: hypothetical protein R3E10_00875 [Gemmatimonadota bacterium]